MNMSRHKTRLRRQQFSNEEAAIREIMHQCAPVAFPAPEDEYDCLVHQLISLLHAGGTQDDLACRIRDEMESHLALSLLPANGIDAIAGEVLRCWMKIGAHV